MNGIRYYRKKNHMTQNELADLLGVTQTSVSQWEGGRNYPDIKTAKRLATLFGATLDQILGMEEMPSKPSPDLTGLLSQEDEGGYRLDPDLLEQKTRLLSLFEKLSPLARQRILDRAEAYFDVEHALPYSVHDKRRALTDDSENQSD